MTAGFHCSALFSSSPPSCRDLEIWQRREESQKENTLHLVMKVMNSEEKKGKKEDKEDQRLTSSDSFEKVEEVDVSLVHICSAGENEKHEGERIHSLLLDGMEEVECCDEMCSDVGSSSLGQKKRRLSVDQVRALEKDFEVENKLDPERKIKLARELGLRPRQIAIWFQNRRARWKTKQLERDFDALKTLHDALKLDVDTLRDDKEGLISEIRVLKDKLADSAMAKFAEIEVVKEGEGGEVTAFKDGTLDTDSSAVLSGGSAGYLGRSEMSRCSSFLFEYHRMVGDDNSKSYLEEGLFTGEEFCRSVSPEEQEPSLSW